jgi:hypothetical protein
VLVAVLNSRAVDFAFRRGAAPLQNGFYTANRQFIAWLPVPGESQDELEPTGARLHELAAETETERRSFLDWLASIIGIRADDLAGVHALLDYPRTGLDGVLAVLDRNAGRLTVDPRHRGERESIAKEMQGSTARIAEFDAERERLEHRVDEAVYDAYGLSAAQRARIDGEYER